MALFDFGSEFPVEQFRNDQLGNSMLRLYQPQMEFSNFNPAQSYSTPAQSSYLDFLQQAPPQREDFNQPLWQKILTAIGGIATGYTQKDPRAGFQFVQQMQDLPYNQALQDYRLKAENLARGADIEKVKLGLERQFAADERQATQFGQELGFKREQLGQQASQFGQEMGLKGQDIDLRTKILENQMQQAALDRALQEKRISVEQYNSATQRLRAETEQKSASDPMRYLGSIMSGMGSFGRSPFGPLGQNYNQSQPSAAMLELQAGAAIQSDPILSQYVNSEGNLNIRKMPPEAQARFQEIYKKIGIMK